mgnify:CR=1 FL=1
MRTKKWWIYTACLYIPALLIIGYRYTNSSVFLDLSLVVLVIGIAIVSYKEFTGSNQKKEKHFSQ